MQDIEKCEAQETAYFEFKRLFENQSIPEFVTTARMINRLQLLYYSEQSDGLKGVLEFMFDTLTVIEIVQTKTGDTLEDETVSDFLQNHYYGCFESKEEFGKHELLNSLDSKYTTEQLEKYVEPYIKGEKYAQTLLEAGDYYYWRNGQVFITEI